MAVIARDLISSCRALWRQPGFSATAILCLSAGMASSLVVYTLVRSELLRPLPYADPERLMSVTQISTRYPAGIVLAPEFAAWRQESHTLAQLAAWSDASFTLRGGGEPEFVLGAKTDGQFLDVLGVQPALGRGFALSDDQDRRPVVLLSHALWTRRFGGDARWIGRSVYLNDQPHEIIGVLAVDFRFPGPYQPDVLVPGGYARPPEWSSGSMAHVNVLARLAPNVAPDALATELTALQRQHAADLPAGLPASLAGRATRVLPLATELTGQVRMPLLILMGAVSLVVLIACVNVAGLQVARTVRNYGQLTIRAALGASKASLVRLVLAESAVLSCLGGVIGLVAAALAIRAFPTVAGQLVGPGTGVRMDATVGAFALALAALSVLICGAANFLAIARLDVHRIANPGGRSVVTTSTGVVRYGLLAGQVGIAFVLLFGATLLLRSFANVLLTDTGVRTQGVLTFTLPLPDSQYKPPRIREFARELISRLDALPGVQGAAIANSLPFNPYRLGALIRTKPAVSGDTPQVVPVIAVSPEFFETLGIPALAGELLRDTDGGPQKTAVINSAFVRRFFGGENPLGKNLYWGPKIVLTIVGVVGDVRHVRPEEPPQPEIFVPLDQNPPQSLNVAVRAAALSDSLSVAVRNQVHALDKDLPILRVSSLEQQLADLRGVRRFQLSVLASFAVFGLVLAALGLYASIAYTVSQSRREIAVRMALGAQHADVRNLFLRRAFGPSAAGLAAGGVASVWLASYIRTLLFGVSATDPVSIVLAALIMFATGLLAGYFPALSAARTDPSTTLRYE